MSSGQREMWYEYEENRQNLIQAELNSLTPTEMIQYLKNKVPCGKMTMAEMDGIREMEKNGVKLLTEREALVKLYRKFRGI